ncbi:hypothetical protein CYMTET_50525, partial [Cymbomonas tetramitiformis]
MNGILKLQVLQVQWNVGHSLRDHDPRHLETAISIAGSTCGGALGSALVIGLPTPSDKITLSILSTADTSFWEPELVAQADVWLPEALSAVLEMALHDVE